MGKKASKATVTKEPVQLEPLLSIPEVMAILGLGRDTIYNLIRKDGLPTVKIGERRLVRPSSLDTWIKQREQSVIREPDRDSQSMAQTEIPQ